MLSETVKTPESSIYDSTGLRLWVYVFAEFVHKDKHYKLLKTSWNGVNVQKK